TGNRRSGTPSCSLWAQPPAGGRPRRDRGASRKAGRTRGNLLRGLVFLPPRPPRASGQRQDKDSLAFRHVPSPERPAAGAGPAASTMPGSAMPTPDFERMSVLVVDDTRLFRSLILSVFKSLGIRQIFTAENGVDAIEFLKLVQASPERAGTSQIDLIVTDLMMPKMNGLMLLRWLRLHPSSPDRFVPVIAISGAAESDVVATARDLGATEIVGKPVSAETLANKLLNIVNHPRQFVLAPKYFGPDRRRAERPFEEERRLLADDSIQVINAGDGTKFIRPNARVVYFRLRNR